MDDAGPVGECLDFLSLWMHSCVVASFFSCNGLMQTQALA